MPSKKPAATATATAPSKSKPTAAAAADNDTEAPSTFTDGLALPKLLVFDLDYTLWDFWVDTHVEPPLRALPATHAAHGTRVSDAHGAALSFYPEVPGVLRAARARGLQLAVASRSLTPELAGELLGLLHVDGAGAGVARDCFDSLQIYPSSKTAHMQRLQQALGVAYADMLFFDDEERNRNVERELGVCFWLVRRGVTRAEVDRGVEKWRKARGVAAAKKKKGDEEEAASNVISLKNGGESD